MPGPPVATSTFGRVRLQKRRGSEGRGWKQVLHATRLTEFEIHRLCCFKGWSERARRCKGASGWQVRENLKGKEGGHMGRRQAKRLLDNTLPILPHPWTPAGRRAWRNRARDRARHSPAA